MEIQRFSRSRLLLLLWTEGDVGELNCEKGISNSAHSQYYIFEPQQNASRERQIGNMLGSGAAPDWIAGVAYKWASISNAVWLSG